MWKFERREKKKDAEKNRMKMHGKGMKRVENDLENRAKYNTVYIGMEFLDDKHNRELKVYRQDKHDFDYWMCECTNNNVEVLYRYNTKFILENRK